MDVAGNASSAHLGTSPVANSKDSSPVGPPHMVGLPLLVLIMTTGAYQQKSSGNFEDKDLLLTRPGEYMAHPRAALCGFR